MNKVIKFPEVDISNAKTHSKPGKLYRLGFFGVREIESIEDDENSVYYMLDQWMFDTVNQDRKRDSEVETVTMTISYDPGDDYEE